MAWHEITHRACGQPAFHYEDPRPMDSPVARRARLLDGTTPEPWSEITCGSCGATGFGWVELTIGPEIT